MGLARASPLPPLSVWVFEPDGSHRFFRSRNGYAQQVVAGDWNADGVDDLVFYASGLTKDEVWTSHPNSFSREEVDIFARYRLVTVRGTDRDHVLMFGVGNRRDASSCAARRPGSTART